MLVKTSGALEVIIGEGALQAVLHKASRVRRGRDRPVFVTVQDKDGEDEKSPMLHRKGRGKKVLKKEEKVIHPSLGRKNPMSLLLPIISILLLSLLVLLVRVGTTTYPDPEG